MHLCPRDPRLLQDLTDLREIEIDEYPDRFDAITQRLDDALSGFDVGVSWRLGPKIEADRVGPERCATHRVISSR